MAAPKIGRDQFTLLAYHLMREEHLHVVWEFQTAKKNTCSAFPPNILIPLRPFLVAKNAVTVSPVVQIGLKRSLFCAMRY